MDVISGAAPKPTPLKNTTKISSHDSDKNSKTTKQTINNTVTKVVELEPCPEPASNKVLDILQFIVDVIGFIPGVGDRCDGVNALIYFARTKGEEN